MKVTSKKFDEMIKKFLEGGPVEAPVEAPTEGAPAPEQLGEDPMELILQAAAQAVQTQDAQLALQVCQALVEAAGGGAPAPAPEGEPVYRAGGRLAYRIKK